MVPLYLSDIWLLALETIGFISVFACIINLALGLTDKVIKLPETTQLPVNQETVSFGGSVKVVTLYNFLLALLYNLFSLPSFSTMRNFDQSNLSITWCYIASSERKLLLHKLMCIVLSAVVIALCRAIRVVCLHDVSMIAIGVEGADQGEEETSHHHVAPGMSLPHEPSHMETPQMADQSILLDYISPDPITIFITSLENRHWRIAWHTFVASTCQISPILAGYVFTRSRQGLTRATMVNPPNFYISLTIMGIYCIALPFARPPPGYRTPRPLRALFDLALYCYHSRLPRLPEFEIQHPSYEEKHLKAKVVLKKRQYQFGLYLCDVNKRHLGISPAIIVRDDTPFSPVDRTVVDSSGIASWGSGIL
jgi:hypothetical protein